MNDLNLELQVDLYSLAHFFVGKSSEQLEQEIDALLGLLEDGFLQVAF